MRPLLALAAALALVATGLTTAAAPAHALETVRIEGGDRYATAVAADRSVEGAGGPVYLASGVKFPDALAAAPVVAAEGGHLLLTRPDVLPAVVAQRIRELAPSEIVVVGSAASISEQVVAEAVAAADSAPAVERLGGAGRVETSLLLLERLRETGPVDHVWIASGANFPDALVAASVAGLQGQAVVLDHHGDNPAGRQAWLELVAPYIAGSHVLIAGGDPSVSAADAAGLERAGARSIDRFAGRDRYETASVINGSWAEPQAATVLLATGQNFPDALAGAALSAFSGAPLFLTPNACHAAITPMLRQRADEIGADAVVGLGSAATVSDEALRLERCSAPLRQQIAQAYGAFSTQRYSGTGTRTIDLGRTIPYAQVVTSARSSGFIGIQALNAAGQAYDTIGYGFRSYRGTGLLQPIAPGVPTRYLRVEADGPWSLEIRDLTSAPVIGASAAGTADAVYLYDGPAASLTVTNVARRMSVAEHYGYWQSGTPFLDGSLPGSGIVHAGPSVIQIRATESWSLQIR